MHSVNTQVEHLFVECVLTYSLLVLSSNHNVTYISPVRYLMTWKYIQIVSYVGKMPISISVLRQLMV